MPDVRFFYKAEPSFSGALRVREYFRHDTGEKRLHPNGESLISIVTEGLVDDGIKKEHAEEYAAVEAVLREHGDTLLEVARANPGVLVPIEKISKDEKGEGDEAVN